MKSFYGFHYDTCLLNEEIIQLHGIYNTKTHFTQAHVHVQFTSNTVKTHHGEVVVSHCTYI